MSSNMTVKKSINYENILQKNDRVELDEKKYKIFDNKKFLSSMKMKVIKEQIKKNQK